MTTAQIIYSLWYYLMLELIGVGAALAMAVNKTGKR